MKKTYFIALLLMSLFIVGGVAYGTMTQSKQVANKTTEEAGEIAEDSAKDVELTLAELIKHDSEDDCWMVIEDKVYDVTSYISAHPGGDEILRGCGRDATPYYQLRQDDEGEAIGSGQPHSDFAGDILKDFELGSFKK